MASFTTDTGSRYDDEDPSIIQVFDDGETVFTPHVADEFDAACRAAEGSHADEAALVLCEYDNPPAGWQLLGWRAEGKGADGEIIYGVSVYRKIA